MRECPRASRAASPPVPRPPARPRGAPPWRPGWPAPAPRRARAVRTSSRSTPPPAVRRTRWASRRRTCPGTPTRRMARSSAATSSWVAATSASWFAAVRCPVTGAGVRARGTQPSGARATSASRRTSKPTRAGVRSRTRSRSSACRRACRTGGWGRKRTARLALTSHTALLAIRVRARAATSTSIVIIGSDGSGAAVEAVGPLHGGFLGQSRTGHRAVASRSRRHGRPGQEMMSRTAGRLRRPLDNHTEREKRP